MTDVERLEKIKQALPDTSIDDVEWLLSKVHSLRNTLSDAHIKLFAQIEEASRRARYENDYLPYGDEEYDR